MPQLHRFGITRVADITGLDVIGIPVYQAIRPRSRSLSVSQGKGVSALLAKVSAVMEAVELHHAERLPPGLWATARELDALPYDPAGLLLAHRSVLTPDLILEWTPACTVLTGQSTFLPADYVRLDSRVRRVWSPPLFFTTSNGLASGNSVDEAALHGLYELIERDSVAELADLRPSQQPRLDLATVDDPDCLALLSRFTAAGVTVEVLDATSDIDVPCYRADLWSADLPLIFSGSGCHLSPAVALARALTEAAQSRLTLISGARDDIVDRLYALQADPRLGVPRPRTFGPQVRFRRGEVSDDLCEDLRLTAARVTRHSGVEPIMAELGGPDGFAVVKVAASGLRFQHKHELLRGGAHD